MVFQPEELQLQCVNITIVDEVTLEEDEVFFVSLTSDDPGVVINPPQSLATVVILNDDGKAIINQSILIAVCVYGLFCFTVVNVGFELEEYIVNEDENDTLVCADLSGETERAVNVTVLLSSGTAEGLY